MHTHVHTHHRASDPDEVYRVHEMKAQREHLQDEESHLDHLIQMCKHELSLLTENQENWQYPFNIHHFSELYFWKLCSASI